MAVLFINRLVLGRVQLEGRVRYEQKRKIRDSVLSRLVRQEYHIVFQETETGCRSWPLREYEYLS